MVKMKDADKGKYCVVPVGLRSLEFSSVRMKFLAFFSVLVTTDTILMCLSDNISRTETEIMKNNQKKEKESKHFSGKGKFGMDQERTDMTFAEITSGESSIFVVNSNVTPFHFNEKQNVPKPNEEINIVPKRWYSWDVPFNFNSNRNLKNINFSSSDIKTLGTRYEYSKTNTSLRMEVESRIQNMYDEPKLLGKNKRKERSKPMDTDLNTETILPTVPEIWYDILTQNFSCSIQQYEELSISCSNISMYEISVFLPTNTVTLDISNCLQIIVMKPLFSQLKHLRSLKLTNNHHRFIIRAFIGLEALEELDLSRNNIMVLLEFTFMYTPMLKSLNLTHNSVIEIGAIASALENLTLFENLTLDENTDINFILKKDLEHLKSTKLSYLSLYNTTIEIIEKNAFYFLPYLRILDLTVNYVNEIALANLTSSLNNTSIEFLYVRYTFSLDSFPYEALTFLQNTSLFNLDMSYNYFPTVEIFPYIPSLESLVLTNCLIRDIRDGAFKELPNLQEVRLDNNELLQFPYATVSARNLKILYLSYQASEANHSFVINDFIFENLTELQILHLEYVSLSPTLSRYAFFGLLNLKLLFLEKTTLEDIEEFAFETLASLLILDLQGNNLRYLNNYTFFGLQNLVHLYLNENNLIFVEGYLPFHQLPVLSTLLIQNNKIDNFPNQIFSSLNNLYVLILSGNKIVPWNSKLLHPNLTITILGLSKNQITHITPTMLAEFGQVSEYLDLRKNPFNCSACGMEDFQAFFKNSNLTFSLPDQQIDHLSYTCMEPVFLQNQPFENVELPVVNCEIEEAALISLAAIALTCFVILFATLVSFLCFFFRWYIRYWIFQVRARMNEKESNDSEEPRYIYDAFVSYNSANTPWVVTYLIPALEVQEPKFKLCVHERDFQVGSLITENILEAIDASRKVILILSERFIKSEWCMFELHMAQHKLFYDTRDGLILVKLEDINKKLYTKNLVYLEKTRLCLEWKENTFSQKLFWEQLQKALGPPISNKVLVSETLNA